jgi:fatty acid desaturase
MNPSYVRRVNDDDRFRITLCELMCCMRAAAIPGCVLLGFTPWTRLPMLYLLGVSVLILNQLRLLADHHYQGEGDKMSFSEHLLDSCNYTGRDFFTWLLYPFSIRFHALHHLFPSMPYHNLAAADGYLLETLPADSPYHQLTQPGWLAVARKTVSARHTPHRHAERPVTVAEQ